MPFELNQVVPWGRSFGEYVAMFSLSGADLRKRILGVADGPAAFNAEFTDRGGTIVSVDPLYAYSRSQIEQRVHDVAPVILSGIQDNLDDFKWDFIPSPDHLLQLRLDSMTRFADDYERGKQQGRYVAASVPCLPFEANSFELVVCSHFLLLYGEVLDFDFHYDALIELLRLAPEVRIFPILELGSFESRHLERLRQQLAGLGHSSESVNTNYEFQRGGNQMLVITRAH